MDDPYHELSTRLIHSGEPHPRIEGAVAMPVFQSATFADAGHGVYDEVRYIRLNNTPNHLALHRKLAAVEGAEAALVAGSGMAAISTALLAVLGSGDHLLVQDTLYGGTHTLVHRDLPRFGIGVETIDPRKAAGWEAQLRPETRAIYVEALGNPLLTVPDLEGVVAFARRHELVSIIDNTFATPVNLRPLRLGFDLCLHSATKYLNGHSDLVAGAVAGSAAWIERILHLLNHLGGTLDPHACVLLHRGLKTLELRVLRQNASALDLAHFLERHSAIARVYYPGLASHPDHQRAAALFRGFGGVLSFELVGGVEAAERLLAKLRIPVVAPSLGGVETLVTRPSLTSHAGLEPAERARLGISDGLVRLAVGIEDAGELAADLDQALAG